MLEIDQIPKKLGWGRRSLPLPPPLQRPCHKVMPFPFSGLTKVIFLAVVEAEGEDGKTSAFEVKAEGKAEGEAEGLVFCI